MSLLGLVGAVQGLAWIGAAGDHAQRRTQGMWLAPVGLLLFGLGVLWILVPDFFFDRAGFDGS